MPITSPELRTICKAADSAAAVVVENVSKRYASGGLFRRPRTDGRTALDGVSLAIEEGETVGLLGPNGAGKTTLLKSIATLLEVTEGRILVHGQDVVADPMRARREMGLVTCDERSFYWRLTGRQNLEFFASLYGVPRSVSVPRIAELLETLSLSEAADRPYSGYSTGMRQKMAIARGLLSNPSLILFDEPTRSLDPLSAVTIRKWIREERAAHPRTTRIIATNQLDEASLLCDRIIIINRGRILAGGTIEEITKRFRAGKRVIHRITCRNYSFSAGHMELLDVTEERTDGDLSVIRLSASEDSYALTAALNAIIQAGGSVIRCEAEQIPFESVFCSMVMEDARVAAVAGGAR